ncbi:amidohydrolase [Nitratireductor indicus C115]|uniref:Amidohydrolase n=1 Tax=Nitratireductor indicus C115 TaxID=1231190 RepID=K2P1Y9_9HYPH|nr:amidohydrolase [Nitratireductor indicus]EKF41406.1 amidohydrolase [Nitratireductor indicus C115]SFQ72124.1 5-methylthioadenosine/S-adenosylhomocysteine deaminase [Nitratireductor indicus]
MTADLVIRNAIVVTCDEAGTVLRDGGLVVRGGRIARLGQSSELEQDAASAKTVVDAAGHILMPGLVNAHCHAADSLFRGLVEDLPLEPWLQKVWQAEGAILNPRTSHLGSVLGCAELLLSGVTSVMDMFWYPVETVRAARKVGMRVSTGGFFFDGPGVTGGDLQTRIADAEAFFEEFGKAEDVFPATLPHGAYTVGPENLKTAREIADRHGGLFSTHAAETKAEQDDIRGRYGSSVIRHLDYLDLLDEKTTLAHCVHLDDEEIEILARTGATVSHNPVSNLKLASGIARVPDMLEAGVNVALGTDGAISGNDLDMWMALRLAATLHKGARQSADAVSTPQALAMATMAGARALGAEDRIGSLETGKFADMILVDIRRPHAVPMFDPVTHLVYSTAKSDVRHVFVGGRQVVRDGVLTLHAIEETMDEVNRLVPRIAAAIA